MPKLWGVIGKELVSIRYGVELSVADDTARSFLKAMSEHPPDEMGGKLHDKFAQDMKDCLKVAKKEAKEKSVSHPTIENLFSNRQETIGKKALPFIAFYLEWISNKKAFDQNKAENLLKLRQELNELCKNEEDSDEFHKENIDIFEDSIPYIEIKESAQSTEEIPIFANHIFRNREYNEKYDNAAYFVAYRQSTIPNRVLKSFIAILTPAENMQKFFSYVHVVKGPDDVHDITKTTRGIISHMPPATYFIGVTRRNNSNRPQNHEVIVFERDILIASMPLLYGLTLSSAALNQPILARIVLLRIGDRRSLERRLTHDDIGPTEFHVDDIENVIEKDMENIPDGFKHFSHTVLHAKGLADRIKQGIQNVAYADIRMSVGAEKPTSFQGVLETWTFGPRP